MKLRNLGPAVTIAIGILATPLVVAAQQAPKVPRIGVLTGYSPEPYISGVPHRIRYLEAILDYMWTRKGVWFATGEEIYAWYRNRGGI